MNFHVHDTVQPCPACGPHLRRDWDGRPINSICPPVVEESSSGSGRWRVHCHCCGGRTEWAARPQAIGLWNDGVRMPVKQLGGFHGRRRETV